VYLGRQEYGSKTLVEQAVEYRQLAQSNPHQFASPRVLFLFNTSSNLPTNLIETLSKLGVNVQCLADLQQRSTDELETPIVTCDTDETRNYCELKSSLLNSSSASVNAALNAMPCSASTQLSTVNLDITTLIALTSNVCNGGANYSFADAVLSEQAAAERTEPCLPRIQEFLANKQLIVPESARNDFLAILNVVGGATEKQRAHKLLQSVTVVVDSPSPRSLQLPVTSHIKFRARTVFGTGDNHQAVTTTANVRFVRAAAQAGVEFVVFIHPARALTELKQLTAV